MAISKIPNAGISDAVNFRNILINGDMSIAQRGTSVASISSGNTIHTCDRWKTYVSSAGTWTQTQEALTSGDAYNDGFSNSLKLDCTTANGSLSSGSYLIVAQSIEAQNLQYIKKGTSNAEQLTASFWVKSTKTGTNIVQFVSLDDTVRICAKSYTISSSDTWEKKTITIPADTSSTGNISNDNGEGLRMLFWVAAGTDFTSGTLATTWQDTANANRAVGQVNNADSTSNNFEITGVQLEAGTTASDFEFLPYDVNKNRCLRYYYVHAEGDQKEIACGFYYTANYLTCHLQFPQEMRAAPSLVKTSGTNYYRAWRANTSDNFDDFNNGIQSATTTSCGIDGTTGVSGTQGEGNRIITVNSSSLIAFSSEL